MSTGPLLLVGLVMLVGLVGVLVPGMPGVVLCWAGVLWWALDEQSGLAWGVLLGASAVLMLSLVLKWFLPGRHMREAGVPWNTLLVASAAGAVGFFVIPVIGLVIGFLLGMYLVERARLGGHRPGWQSTKTAMRAIGVAVLSELLAALLIVGTWAGAVIFG